MKHAVAPTDATHSTCASSVRRPRRQANADGQVLGDGDDIGARAGPTHPAAYRPTQRESCDLTVKPPPNESNLDCDLTVKPPRNIQTWFLTWIYTERAHATTDVTQTSQRLPPEHIAYALGCLRPAYAVSLFACGHAAGSTAAWRVVKFVWGGRDARGRWGAHSSSTTVTRCVSAVSQRYNRYGGYVREASARAVRGSLGNV